MSADIFQIKEEQRLLDKLQKLKAHAESAEKIGSMEEAEAFAAMLNRLLLKHKLEMTDIDLKREEESEPIQEFDIDYTKYPDIEVKKVRIEWQERLAGIIARAHFCRIVVNRYSSRIGIIGRKSDVEIAEYMIITLIRATLNLAKKEHSKYAWECYKVDKSTARARGFKRSFIDAFIRRIDERFEAERNAAAGTSSMALVKLNTADRLVADFVKQHYGMARGLTRQKASHVEGMARGRAAADAINLRANAVKSGAGSPTGLLK